MYFSDYKDVDGRKLPHRIEVRYGDKRYAVLTVDKYTLEQVELTAAVAASRDSGQHATHHARLDDHAPWTVTRDRRASRRRRRRPAAADPFNEVAEKVNKKLVKLFGAGGFRGSTTTAPASSSAGRPHPHRREPAARHVRPRRPPVRRPADEGKVVVVEPELDAALIKIRSKGRSSTSRLGLDLAYFDFAEAAKRPPAGAGDWVLAFTNTFEIALRDEPLTVQRGVIAAYTKLAGRRGIFEFPYTGDVYVVDAITNNPGAAGGALIDRKGELLGIIGSEIKNSLTDTWMNYAIPVTAKVDIKIRRR